MKNNNNKIEIYGGIGMFVILIIFLISIVLLSICPRILSKLNLTNEKTDQFFDIIEMPTTKNVDFSKKYVFSYINSNNSNSNANSSSILLLKDKYINIVNILKEKIENNFSEGMFKYEKIIELSYIYNNIINYDMYSNNNDSTISLGDGYYSVISSSYDTKKLANKIIDFSDWAKSRNTNFVYIQTPYKITDDLDVSPIYKDFTNINTDLFLKEIRGKVDYLDLRENIKNEKKNNLSLFFKTDHHWLPETGLDATKTISSMLNEQYNMNLQTDNINKELYNFKTYKKYFLGSAGRKVSLANAEPEDFTLITPKYETKLHIKIEELNLDKDGTFEELFIDNFLLKQKNYYKLNQYAAYMHGDKALIEIHNNLVENGGKKILLIKDSFAEVVSPFLALENEYLSIIDLRHFNGSIKSYIDEYAPDLVIIMYNGAQMRSNHDKNIWNFE